MKSTASGSLHPSAPSALAAPAEASGSATAMEMTARVRRRVLYRWCVTGASLSAREVSTYWEPCSLWQARACADESTCERVYELDRQRRAAQLPTC